MQIKMEIVPLFVLFWVSGSIVGFPVLSSTDEPYVPNESAYLPRPKPNYNTQDFNDKQRNRSKTEKQVVQQVYNFYNSSPIFFYGCCNDCCQSGSGCANNVSRISHGRTDAQGFAPEHQIPQPHGLYLPPGTNTKENEFVLPLPKKEVHDNVKENEISDKNEGPRHISKHSTKHKTPLKHAGTHPDNVTGDATENPEIIFDSTTTESVNN